MSADKRGRPIERPGATAGAPSSQIPRNAGPVRETAALPPSGSMSAESPAASASAPKSQNGLRALLDDRTVAAPPTRETAMRISLRPGGESSVYVHEFVSKYAAEHFRASVASSVSLATLELLSNALAYGSALAPVVFEIDEADGSVAVRVSNSSIPARIKRLVELVEKIERSPRDMYTEQLQRSMQSPARIPLGLARVAHEGSMKLQVTAQGEHVAVAALCRR